MSLRGAPTKVSKWPEGRGGTFGSFGLGCGACTIRVVSFYTGVGAGRGLWVLEVRRGERRLTFEEVPNSTGGRVAKDGPSEAKAGVRQVYRGKVGVEGDG